MSLALYGKTVVVTGGSRGIGLAIARTYAAHGANCLLVGRDEQRLRSATAELPRMAAGPLIKSPPHHHYYLCDLANETHIKELGPTIRKAYSGVDILVNAAGVNYDALLLRASPDHIQRTTQVNLVGTMLLTQQLLRSLLKREQGSIINISSVVGVQGNPGQSVYAASKAGLIGFTKSLAKELGPRRIRVNCIAPGFIRTDMTKDLIEKSEQALVQRIGLGRLGQVEDVAHTALYLATADYVTGEVLKVDGGLTL